MRKRKDEVKVTGILSVIFVCLCMGLPFAVSGGSLEPSAPPGPTMTTLDQLRLNCPSDDPNKTNLLFPMVTNRAGWETSVVILNTGMDPFGGDFHIVGEQGACKIHFFDGTTSVPAPTETGPIKPGGSYSNSITGLVSGASFQGYMIATCNFPFAHGFGFIQDLTSSSMGSSSYLALVLCTNRSENRVERLLP